MRNFCLLFAIFLPLAASAQEWTPSEWPVITHYDAEHLQQIALIRQNIGRNYEQFSGRTLEQYFQAKTMETGLYTQVGNWWDRKGVNEIDMIALNEFDHTAVAAEIKRNPKKISMSDLQTKVDALPKSEFKQYQFELKGLSIEDM